MLMTARKPARIPASEKWKADERNGLLSLLMATIMSASQRQVKEIADLAKRIDPCLVFASSACDFSTF